MDEGRDEQDDEEGGEDDAQRGAEPMKVAMLTASGPGVDSDTAMKLRNSASESQPWSRTFSRMREIMP